MCLEIFPLSIKVVKFLWNFEPETSNFGRCYSSNLLDAADMVRYDRGWGSQNARDKLTTCTAAIIRRGWGGASPTGFPWVEKLLVPRVRGRVSLPECLSFYLRFVSQFPNNL